MVRIEKTVFISYRRANSPWALAIYQSLTHRGYDVFIDYRGIGSGDFEQVILGNVRARAHFLVLLTPSALEKVGEPCDWLRREIEAALDTHRNIVPLMLEGFDFDTPSIAAHLTGTLSALRRYNALPVAPEYFEEAMSRLCERYLAVPLDSVLHPASAQAVQAGQDQQRIASAAPAVTAPELSAEQLFELGFQATSTYEQLCCYSEAIHLKPDFAEAYHNRGINREVRRDLEGALKDYNEAIRLKPDLANPHTGRGNVLRAKGDLKSALKEFDQAIRLKPDFFEAYSWRGRVRRAKGDREGALRDYNEAIRLSPNYVSAYIGRGDVRHATRDLESALKDYNEAIRLKPWHASAHMSRADVRRAKGDVDGAIEDYRRYLELGAVLPLEQARVESIIRILSKKGGHGRWSLAAFISRLSGTGTRGSPNGRPP